MSNAEALDLPAVAQEGLGRDFYLIWLGQAISMIGTQLTGFAFSVWTAKAMEDYTLYILVATLPALLLLPWSGGFADRHPELRTSKGTIRLRPQDAAALADDELLSLVSAALAP